MIQDIMWSAILTENITFVMEKLFLSESNSLKVYIPFLSIQNKNFKCNINRYIRKQTLQNMR